MRTCMHRCVHACTDARACTGACMYAQMRVHACIDARMHAHTYPCMHAQMPACMHTYRVANNAQKQHWENREKGGSFRLPQSQSIAAAQLLLDILVKQLYVCNFLEILSPTPREASNPL